MPGFCGPVAFRCRVLWCCRWHQWYSAVPTGTPGALFHYPYGAAVQRTTSTGPWTRLLVGGILA